MKGSKIVMKKTAALRLMAADVDQENAVRIAELRGALKERERIMDAWKADHPYGIPCYGPVSHLDAIVYEK